MALALGPLLAGAVLSACGTSEVRVRAEPGSPTTTSVAPGGAPAVRLTTEDQADLHLWISNQSFLDDPVHLTVSIDGVEVVDRRFEVGSQHNWELFPLAAEPGKHALVAESDTGVSTRRTFTLPGEGRRHAVLDYWYYEDGDRHFSWRIQGRPLAFM